jgi:hypothetical protein
MQLVIDFYFHLFVCDSTCFERQALIIRSPPLYMQPPVFVLVSVLGTVLQDSAKDGHKHRNWRLRVQWGTHDDERLTLETCRVAY